ncbi:MAG: hypothetical protein Q7R30_19915 [Acidobacteriota bacterium]|nr:hypothetical protein [Acidobacteriota bacterium]
MTLLRQEAVARLPAVALAEKFGRVVGILGILDSQQARQLAGQILRGGRNHPLTERKSSRLEGEG